MPFLEHADQFNPSQSFLRRAETLESQHRTTLAFDTPVILFDDVIEVLALANLDALIVVIIVLMDCGHIRATFVDIDESGFTISVNGFG